MKSLNLIGAGRVGRTLARLWHEAGRYQVQDVLTRSQLSAQEATGFIGAGRVVTQLTELRDAEVWLLAVPDRHIAEVAHALARTLGARQARVVLHCSGALGAAELQPLRERGCSVASAHCVLSFANPQAALAQFAGTPCALEGDAAAVTELELAFTQIGARCFALAAEHKLRYHAGAVFATNFVPVLQAVANQLWLDSGVPPDVAAHLNATLLKNAVENILNLGPAGALTGPAARGDVALVQEQAESVTAWNAQAGAAYAALSQLILQPGFNWR